MSLRERIGASESTFTPAGRVPPQALEAEMSVLGAMLLEKEASVRRTLNATAQRLARLRSDPAHAAEIAELNAGIDRLTSNYRAIIPVAGRRQR